MPWPQFNHIQLLRYAGLFQYASVGTPFLRYQTVVEDLAQKQLPGSYVHLWLGCYLVFGVVYWYLTRDLGDRRRTLLRRALQIALLVVLNLMAVKRLGNGDDIAAAVAYITSDEAGFLTGQTICVDGGMTMC